MQGQTHREGKRGAHFLISVCYIMYKIQGWAGVAVGLG